MKLVKEGTLNKVQASENMYLATKDKSQVFGNYLYLGKFDSENNYIEVTKTERDEIIRINEEKAENNPL